VKKFTKYFLRVCNVIDVVNEWIGMVLYPLCLVIAVLVFAEVTCRYVFNSPTLWIMDVSQMLFVICVMMAGGHLLQRNDHIVVDIFYSQFPRRLQLIVDFITFPIAVGFIASLVYFGYDFALESFSKREVAMTSWSPQIWPVKTMLFFGPIMLLVQLIADTARKIIYFLSQDAL
jgi:TRAP-type mannitol/chloroaromatic compound transport system permease small subunit